ncbi:alpha/beta fold hydrolase [Streptomyces sp. NBC_01296]|uniref:alpha/beta fold hydrolase n=1 Tax=Streptomyces sp. NBC_01296 TaxID=2903816 RepID=UPI002E0FED2B|nr:alpha/beta fold hydrolase [Streptomyces sp. NBC_01296]
MKRLAPLLATVGLVATSLSLLTAPQAAAAQTPGYMRQKPAWHRCSPDRPVDYECATLKVPLDYQHPEGRTLDLAISRMKSENPAKRRGVLLFNPGGPGAKGLMRPVGLNARMPKDVRERYDLIGFDPRGVGESSPITCGGLSQAEQGIGGAYRPETFPSDVAWARGIADKCREKSGDVIPYITTRNTARDLDVIRAALGERKISYLSLAENGPRPTGGDAPQLKRPLAGAPASEPNTSGPNSESNSAAPGTVEAPGDYATAVYWSVVCGDTDAWPRDPDQYARDAVRDKAKYPLYGDFASNIKPCAFWQRPLEPAAPMKTRADVLTVQNEWDPTTPLVSGQGLHKALKGSRMALALGGESHGVYLSNPAPCTDATVNEYLATGRLPAEDVTCQDPPPFP